MAALDTLSFLLMSVLATVHPSVIILLKTQQECHHFHLHVDVLALVHVDSGPHHPGIINKRNSSHFKCIKGVVYVGAQI